MYAEINKNAVLFYKALQDLWCAEQTYKGSPNNAVWSCCQAVEKYIKGLLQCYHASPENFVGIHDLSILLEELDKETELSPQTVGLIQNLARYDQRLRYKNLKGDPSVEEAKSVIADTKIIIREFDEHAKCSTFINEAKEVYDKLLKANIGSARPTTG